jgi:mannan endo-1,4-beta-mannosidase
MKRHAAVWIVLVLLIATIALPSPAAAQDTYSISGTNILKNGAVARFVGANALHQYGVGSSNMPEWQLNIAREIVTLNAAPLTGSPVKVGGTWYHSLQNVVNDNRANGLVTILCPFGWWNGSESISFVGLNPSETSFWENYKTQMRAIANQFKNQPDVWIEVWNEPYWYDNSHGYSAELWLSDMKAMVDNIRSTGATNIVLVPGNESGQSEDVILSHGASLLSGRSNILFDIHAYENWLNDSKSSVKSRLQTLRNAGFAVAIGEVGPRNSTLMNPSTFLSAVLEEGNSTLAWFWKKASSDQNALLDDNGNPNNNNNNNWGTTYKNFAANFYSGYTPPASNKVLNPGFESGSTSWSGWGAYSAVQSNARSGSYAGKIGTSNGALEQTITGLKANTRYTLKGWARVDTSGQSVNIGVKNFGGTETTRSITATSYTQATITFTTGSNATSALIYCYKPGKTGNAYCDDFELYAN